MTAEHDRPSARAVERLATGVGDDVSDLRTQLHRALDEAERLAADGRDDLAVTVLEEQREALLTVHQRLQARLADAAVEREAERVLGSAVPAVPESAAASGPAPAEPALVNSDGTSLRLLASAVAAVLGIALLLSPEFDRTELTAAGAAGASDLASVDDQPSRPDEPETGSQTTPSATTAEHESPAQERSHLAAGAIPDLPPGWAAEDEDRDADLTDAAELVPLPVDPSLDALSHVPDGLAGDGDGTDGDQDAAGSTNDDDTDKEDGDATITSGHGTSEQPREGDEPSQDGTTGTDDGTDDTATEEDAQAPDQADDGSADTSDDPGDGSPTGGDLDLDGTGQDPALDR